LGTGRFRARGVLDGCYGRDGMEHNLRLRIFWTWTWKVVCLSLQFQVLTMEFQRDIFLDTRTAVITHCWVVDLFLLGLALARSANSGVASPGFSRRKSPNRNLKLWTTFWLMTRTLTYSISNDRRASHSCQVTTPILGFCLKLARVQAEINLKAFPSQEGARFEYIRVSRDPRISLVFPNPSNFSTR
jgi:hypothetical protein